MDGEILEGKEVEFDAYAGRNRKERKKAIHRERERVA
jgi:hypothetical protein